MKSFGELSFRLGSPFPIICILLFSLAFIHHATINPEKPGQYCTASPNEVDSPKS
jgi:hypothetical protein